MKIHAPLLAAALAAAGHAQDGLSYPVETYRLDNGLTVTLHEDHSLPQVVVDVWYRVGSKDEPPKRTGFAHLFEHLMFMGTARVPDNEFDVLMESGGGWNNATTSADRTNYFSVGPSALLPTLLWLDADRLEALGANMTQEKLDLQRGVVRNERRQTSENTPYGLARLVLPELLYPEGHPYHHPVLGSHEDLEAATVEDVVAFFDTYYVPANASLVVAGDFEPERVKELVEETFGQIPYADPPAHRGAAPASLAHELRRVEFDRVQFPKLILAWHSPPFYEAGDGEMDLIAGVLAGGRSTRLEKRLVLERRLALEVEAYQASGDLGSSFRVEAVAAEGVDLEELKREILAVLDELEEAGPTAAELERVKASTESEFLQRMESLFARADRMNAYLRHFGDADGFQRDLERWTKPSREDLAAWARAVFVPEHVDLRVLPEGEEVPEHWKLPPVSTFAVHENALDRRPDDFPRAAFAPPAPFVLTLSNGVELLAVPRPGSGLFAGELVSAGGVGALPAGKAGLATLALRLLGSGAGGLDASAFAAAVEQLGATIEATPDRYSTRVSVQGLSSRLGPTLDRFADVILRPNLTPADFEREKALLLAAIEARADNPRTVASVVARARIFGREHPSGVALDGYAATVAGIEHAEVAPALAALLHPARTRFVFAGDFEPEKLRAELERRFADWRGDDGDVAEAPALAEPPEGRLILVDRPGAAQTMIVLMRPLPPAEDVDRATRACVETLFGRSFTSRLNQNLRERNKYTYGAGCRLRQEGGQHVLMASSAVHTPVTAAALSEFQKEFAALASGDVTADELEKARETVRARVVGNVETTSDVASTFAGLLDQHRAPGALRADLAALDQVTLDGANTLAKSGLFDWKSLQIVLVGDRTAILPQLADAGFPDPLEANAEGGTR